MTSQHSTPGHFLIGSALTAPINPRMIQEKIKLSSRWQLVQKLKQDLWDRWSSEYLHTLQTRYQWKSKKKANVEHGTLVVGVVFLYNQFE